jgi:16S rRNA (uracil1498-N3)-methyltransferase
LPRIRLELCSSSESDGKRLWRLDEYQERHLVKSLRCYEGAMVEGLLDECGGVRILMRLERGPDCFLLNPIDVSEEPADSLEMTLLIGLLKHDQFESVLRTSAELGVRAVRPVLCERSVPQPHGREMDKKMSRWRRILGEGTKVSGSVFVPELSDPVKFRDIEWDCLPGARYAALLSHDARPLAAVGAARGGIVLAVGPEGDWTDYEASMLLERGFAPVSLGRRILRASTAAAVCCAWFRMAAELPSVQDLECLGTSSQAQGSQS